ncbi:Crp/Fnr family transcriptional regulator [Actinoplanes sp. Pm04-4]|uniref:Crp/Fnr family transcriptional regulator n=1 Tax=Paractinoplanes pyxinae TaxID=2997416 RepID=A0ABT4BCC9_9ACTN|nr:Crp/Fnr family transcriptional regulator [Actinoplanes pyxinae]MCY1144169.1 Crp/Fnr family transcriptional regulator [Actinoplanes pyxinae]
MTDLDDARIHNFLLSALPADEWQRMRPHLRLVTVHLKETMYEAGQAIEHVDFPVSAVLSMITQVDQETAVEVATIGREGMAGLPVFLGVSDSPNTVVAQIEGLIIRMPAARLREFLLGDGILHAQLHRYVQATIVQLSQNVACNQLHTTEERAARWLLMTADRVGSPQFALTQEFLAQMLGVRRATVSLTAGMLQSAGLISYRRGNISITDRAALQDAACDCYPRIRSEFDRLRNNR